MHKKIVFCMLAMTVFAFGLQAQRQYYYRVGDTIRGRDSIYFYQWWSEDWLSDTIAEIKSEDMCVIIIPMFH